MTTTPDLTLLQARVLEAARSLHAADVRLTSDVIIRHMGPRDRPTLSQLNTARTRLHDLGLWPEPIRRYANAGRHTGKAAADRARIDPGSRYLGSFAEDMDRQARILRRFRRDLAARRATT